MELRQNSEDNEIDMFEKTHTYLSPLPGTNKVKITNKGIFRNNGMILMTTAGPWFFRGIIHTHAEPTYAQLAITSISLQPVQEAANFINGGFS